MAISSTTATQNFALNSTTATDEAHQAEVSTCLGSADQAQVSTCIGLSGFDSATAVKVDLGSTSTDTAVAGTGPGFRVSAQGTSLVAANGADPSTAAKATLADFNKQTGAQLANETLQFSEKRLESKDYQTLTWAFDGAPDQKLALDVKADAMAYIAKTPGLQEACDKMIAACGAIPAKVDGLKVDFALNHFATVGEAAGLSWGKTQTQVEAMLETSATPAPVFRDTKGQSGITLSGPVQGGTRTFVNVDGKNNKVDFCTNPYPRPTGTADVVLGGLGNSGQVDLVGTIVVKAGDGKPGNTWAVKDPSQRPALNPPPSDLAAAMKTDLAANAKTCDVVLEGNSADWSVLANGATATYTNQKTGTSVTIPAGAQTQVKYLDSTALNKLAGDLKDGVATKSKTDPKTTKTDPNTTTTSTSAGSNDSAVSGSSAGGTSPSTATTAATGATGATGASSPVDAMSAIDAMLSALPPAVAKKVLAFLLQKLGITVGKNDTLQDIQQKLAAALQKPGALTLAQLAKSLVEEAGRLVGQAKKSSDTKDPIDWYVDATGKNKQNEMSRWASEGKSTSRVRGDLGDWQKRETLKQTVDALGFMYAAAALTQAANGPSANAFTDRVAGHTESINAARPGGDGQWTRPLTDQPYSLATNANTAFVSPASTGNSAVAVTNTGTSNLSDSLTVQAAFIEQQNRAGDDKRRAEEQAAIGRVVNTARGLGLTATQYETFVNEAWREIRDAEVAAMNDGKELTYPIKTPKTDARLDEVRPNAAKDAQQVQAQYDAWAAQGVESTWSISPMEPGKVLKLREGYTLKSNNTLYDAAGKAVARVDPNAGKVFDLSGTNRIQGTERAFYDDLFRGEKSVVAG